MASVPHPDRHPMSVACAVVTISDTRTRETDHSGQLIQQLLQEAGHQVVAYELVKDDLGQIQMQIQTLCLRADVAAIIFNGGTGIAPRDTTYDVIEQALEKTLPGFGELFRVLSYQEIGSRAIASRAVAGVCHHTLVFSLPGSTNAVRLALEKLILPELSHLTRQLQL